MSKTHGETDRCFTPLEFILQFNFAQVILMVYNRQAVGFLLVVMSFNIIYS